IVEAVCNEGPIMKRIRARAMGRAYRIRKRTCHLKIVVEAAE
ncbi:50S ribosomal protein L22, partial [bacterium]|nr:50S ribosomal protein L22 [bacterium]